MTGDRIPREMLSEEEVHALLDGEAPVAALPAAPPVAPAAVERSAVLLVCRRGRETQWLSARLAAHGAAVTCARSPLAALEVIRDLHPSAIVSDLDLWARSGAALLQRARQMDPGVRVLFLVGRGVRAFRLAAGEDGAPWGYLGRPIDPAALETAVTALLAPAGDQEPAAAVDRLAAPAPVPRDEEEERRGEIAWLRFCLALTRELRSRDGLDARSARVLAAARETLGAREVGLSSPAGERFDVRCQCTRRGLPLVAAILAGGEAPAGGALLLGAADGSPRRLVLLGLDPALERAASAFAADVNELLAGALRD